MCGRWALGKAWCWEVSGGRWTIGDSNGVVSASYVVLCRYQSNCGFAGDASRNRGRDTEPDDGLAALVL